MSIAHAYPGTEFYEYAKTNGLITIDGMTDEAATSCPTSFIPDLDRGELMEWVERFYGEYYFRPKAAWRIVRKAIFNNDERQRLYKEASEYLSLRAKRKKFVKDHKTAAAAVALAASAEAGRESA